MSLTYYEPLFEEIDKILQKQNDQKKRGLNDYNMVNVVRKATDEVGMHSNVIYSLINPKGLHYQDDLFLNLFIEHVLEIKDFGTVLEVQREEQTSDGRRIDFTIKSDKYYVGIEMKINAADLSEQIQDYYKDLEEKAENDSGQTVKIYYLTKYGTEPSESSVRSCNKVTTLVSFKDHILNWIDKCQKEIRNITNLNEAFENYKNIVKKITNQYKGNVVTIAEELLTDENKGNLQKALELDKEMCNIKGKILWNFFEKVKEKLEENGCKQIPISKEEVMKDVTQELCKKYNQFKNCSGSDKDFGYAFNCDFGSNLYFVVVVGAKFLYYGVVKGKTDENNLKLENMEDNNPYCEQCEQLKYNSRFKKSWYSNEQNIDMSKNTTLSKLNNDSSIIENIIDCIKNIKENSTK